MRKWIENVAKIKAVISLPEEAFSPFGATVKTSLCIFQKYNEGEKKSDTNNTFLCEIENIGFDATGRERAGSEIDLVIKEFHKQVGWK